MSRRRDPFARAVGRRRRRANRLVTTLASIVSVLLVVVLVTATDTGEELGLPDLLGARQPRGTVVAVTPQELADARAALAALPVKGRAPRTGYDRSLFGDGWVDVDRNGCDTRNDVLRRDLVEITTDPATGGCVVLSGTLRDPFSDEVLAFERGERSAEVQVDHLVALSDAWQKGAQEWSAQRRVAFANDPANLLAVDGALNQAKGDSDAATWLPPHRGFRCRYVLLQTTVKAAYGLWVTAAERDAIARELDRCVVVEPGGPSP
ncbi:MAG: HNH endonuclease [Actinotalea sp.]|nr:HNH endonuclease [Actinotalea sp.]